jgi:uncharacterized protein involved in cysteine biosynthesis
MILNDFLKALAQLSDPRFRRVLWIGLGLTLLLLVLISLGFVWLVGVFVPDTVTLPFIGPVGGIGIAASAASVLAMIGLSVFLMVPVASAFTGLYLEEVADAVEARHYPHLPPVARVGLWETLVDSAGFFGILVAVNLVSIVVYLVAGPLVPFIFWGLNGLLLGREYFTLVAMRRLGRQGARAMARRYRGRIWLAGVLMAVPLSLPLVNLLVPVLGAATFTHLFHRLAAQPTAATSG